MTHLVHAIHPSLCGIVRHHNLWFPCLYIKIVIVMHRAQNSNMLFLFDLYAKIVVFFWKPKMASPLSSFKLLWQKRLFLLIVPTCVILLDRRCALNSMPVKKLSTVRFLPLPKQGDARAIAVFLPLFVSLFCPLRPR